ncbi:MAG: hypothetical protein AAGC81_08300 [Pseudomonadota bacterium]
MSFATETRSAGLFSIVREIIGAFAALPNAFAATEDYRRLEEMTDAQLAAKGLKRADIAREVYKAHFS